MVQNFSKIGINFDVFQNMTFDGITGAVPTDKSEFINGISDGANTLTDGYYGIVVLIVLGIFLIQLLSDISQYGLFRYSTTRALAISLGIMSTFGIMMVSVGFMTNFNHLIIVNTLYILLLLYTIISNPN